MISLARWRAAARAAPSDVQRRALNRSEVIQDQTGHASLDAGTRRGPKAQVVDQETRAAAVFDETSVSDLFDGENQS